MSQLDFLPCALPFDILYEIEAYLPLITIYKLGLTRKYVGSNVLSFLKTLKPCPTSKKPLPLLSVLRHCPNIKNVLLDFHNMKSVVISGEMQLYENLTHLELGQLSYRDDIFIYWMQEIPVLKNLRTLKMQGERNTQTPLTTSNLAGLLGKMPNLTRLRIRASFFMNHKGRLCAPQEIQIVTQLCPNLERLTLILDVSQSYLGVSIGTKALQTTLAPLLELQRLRMLKLIDAGLAVRDALEIMARGSNGEEVLARIRKNMNTVWPSTTSKLIPEIDTAFVMNQPLDIVNHYFKVDPPREWSRSRLFALICRILLAFKQDGGSHNSLKLIGALLAAGIDLTKRDKEGNILLFLLIDTCASVELLEMIFLSPSVPSAAQSGAALISPIEATMNLHPGYLFSLFDTLYGACMASEVADSDKILQIILWLKKSRPHIEELTKDPNFVGTASSLKNFEAPYVRRRFEMSKELLTYLLEVEHIRVVPMLFHRHLFNLDLVKLMMKKSPQLAATMRTVDKKFALERLIGQILEGDYLKGNEVLSTIGVFMDYAKRDPKLLESLKRPAQLQSTLMQFLCDSLIFGGERFYKGPYPRIINWIVSLIDPATLVATAVSIKDNLPEFDQLKNSHGILPQLHCLSGALVELELRTLQQTHSSFVLDGKSMSPARIKIIILMCSHPEMSQVIRHWIGRFHPLHRLAKYVFFLDFKVLSEKRRDGVSKDAMEACRLLIHCGFPAVDRDRADKEAIDYLSPSDQLKWMPMFKTRNVTQ